MNRTDARAAAMKLIYEWEMGGDGGSETLEGILELRPDEPEYDYMTAVVEGVKERVADLDAHIARFTKEWSIDRITRVDLAILRIAAYELTSAQLPEAVVVNEAVELSRIYSTDKAGAFINGVLGGMIRAGSR